MQLYKSFITNLILLLIIIFEYRFTVIPSEFNLLSRNIPLLPEDANYLS